MVHYYRRLVLGVLLGLFLLLVPSTSVLADSPEVVITVSAWVKVVGGAIIGVLGFLLIFGADWLMGGDK